MMWHSCALSVLSGRLTFPLLGCLVTVLRLGFVNACPDDVIMGVYNCLRHVASDETGLTASNDVRILQSKCLDGSFDVTVSCIQHIMHTCRSDSTKQDLLHRTVDVAQMRSAFEFTCDHLDVQADSAHCVSRYKDQINECSSQVAKEFEREKQFAYTTELYLKLICSFVDAITMCAERPVRSYCSAESADVTVRLMSGLKPPGCPPYSRSASISFSPLTTLIMCSVALIVKFGSNS